MKRERKGKKGNDSTLKEENLKIKMMKDIGNIKDFNR